MIAFTIITLLNALCLIPAVLLLVTAGAELFYGNDQPLIAILISTLFGGIAALALLVSCISSVKRRRIAPAIWLLMFATVFNVTSLPVARWMTRFEQDRRYQNPATAATEQNAAGQPATRSESK